MKTKSNIDALTKISEYRCPECGNFTLDSICKICGVPTVPEAELTKGDILLESSPSTLHARHRAITPKKIKEEKEVDINALLDPGEI
jgi:hypothetical protein